MRLPMRDSEHGLEHDEEVHAMIRGNDLAELEILIQGQALGPMGIRRIMTGEGRPPAPGKMPLSTVDPFTSVGL